MKKPEIHLFPLMSAGEFEKLKQDIKRLGAEPLFFSCGVLIGNQSTPCEDAPHTDQESWSVGLSANLHFLATMTASEREALAREIAQGRS